MELLNNKKGYRPNYFADIIIPGIILLLIVIFLTIFFRGNDAQIQGQITVGELEVAKQEELLVFLRTPIEVTEQVTVFVVEETEGEVRTFLDGFDIISFSGSKDLIFKLEDVNYGSASFEVEGDANIIVTYNDKTTSNFKSPGRFDFTQQIKKSCVGACVFSMNFISDSPITIKNIMILEPVVTPGIITQEKKVIKPISQVIIDSFNRQSYTSIEPYVKEFLNNLESGKYGYQMVIRTMPEETTTRVVNSDNFSPGNALRIASVKLPLVDPHSWVEIYLHESMPE